MSFYLFETDTPTRKQSRVGRLLCSLLISIKSVSFIASLEMHPKKLKILSTVSELLQNEIPVSNHM